MSQNTTERYTSLIYQQRELVQKLELETWEIRARIILLSENNIAQTRVSHIDSRELQNLSDRISHLQSDQRELKSILFDIDISAAIQHNQEA